MMKTTTKVLITSKYKYASVASQKPPAVFDLTSKVGTFRLLLDVKDVRQKMMRNILNDGAENEDELDDHRHSNFIG